MSLIVTASLLTQAVLLCFDQTVLQLKLDLLLQTLALVFFGIWSVRAAGTYLNAPMLFLSSVYVWHTPFLLGYYFHLTPMFQFTGNVFTYGQEFVFRAVALVGMCIAMTAFGCHVAYLRERHRAMDPRSRKPLLERCYSSLGLKADQIASWMLIAMLLIFGTYMAYAGRTVLHESYFSIYEDPDGSLLATLFYRTQILWVFVIILLIASRRRRPRALCAVVLLVLSLCIILAMFGDRSMPFICLTAMIIGIDCFVGHIRLVVLASFLVFLSAASFVISETRNSGLGANIFDFSKTGKSLDMLAFVYPTGGIIRDVLRTMDFSQMDRPAYGESFADAALSVIPKPILDRVAYHEPTVPSLWLVENSPDVPAGHGIGYSLVAEAYYNFRMPGCLLFALFGFSIATGYFRYIFRSDMFTIVLTMSITALLMLDMRNDFTDYFRLIVYVSLIMAYLRSLRREAFKLRLRVARGEMVRQFRAATQGMRASSSC